MSREVYLIVIPEVAEKGKDNTERAVFLSHIESIKIVKEGIILTMQSGEQIASPLSLENFMKNDKSSILRKLG